MRAEDLYKAMEGIDDELILRSEYRIETAQEEVEEAERRKKRNAKNSRARFYHYFTIAATTAAAVFLLLMARELAGTRGLKSAKSSNLTSGTVAQSQDEQYMAEAVEEAAAEEAQEEAVQETFSESAEDTVQESGSVQESDSVQSEDTGAPVEAEAPSEESAQDKSLAENAGKTAVDLLGELADEYLALEYISAEDEAQGGSRIVPDYTRAGEAALTAAFESGRAMPSLLANVGKPVYYVYLTRKSGKVEKATFYENEYVGMDSIPGVVMKISHAEYEAVMQLFR